MKRFLIVTAVVAAACTAAQQPKPSPQPQPTTQEINDRFVREITARIAGHEKEPAEQVFKNIQWLKDVPASTFLNIMNLGYSHALGVTCTHCHVETDFSSDDKRPKRAAREMAAMHRMVNTRLHEMQNIDKPPDKRFINCWTCHRGAVDPTTAH